MEYVVRWARSPLWERPLGRDAAGSVSSAGFAWCRALRYRGLRAAPTGAECRCSLYPALRSGSATRNGSLRTTFLASAPLIALPSLWNQTMAPVGQRSMATGEATPFFS